MAARRGTRGKKGVPYPLLFAPAGRRRFSGRQKDAYARRFLRPFGADTLKHERSHGLRTARYAAAGAPPAATIRRPVGAKKSSSKFQVPSFKLTAVAVPVPRPARLPFWQVSKPARPVCLAGSPFPVPAFHVRCEINNVVSPFAEMRLTSKGTDQNRAKRG